MNNFDPKEKQELRAGVNKYTFEFDDHHTIYLDDLIEKLQSCKQKLESMGYYEIELYICSGYDNISTDWVAKRMETDEEVANRLAVLKHKKEEKKNAKKKREEYEKKELARLMKKYKVQ